MSRIDKQYCLNDAVLKQNVRETQPLQKSRRSCSVVGSVAHRSNLSFSNPSTSAASSGSDTVWRRKTESLVLVCLRYLLQLWSLPLLSSFACGQVLGCHGSPGNTQAGRCGVPAERWRALRRPPPPPLFRLCRWEMTKDGGRQGGADDNQLRGEKGGEGEKVSGTERNGGRQRKTGRAVMKVWLMPTVLDIELSWEARS